LRTVLVIVCAALAAVACGATDNPSRPKDPAQWTLSLQHTGEPATTGGGPRAEAAPAAGAAQGTAPGAAGATAARPAQGADAAAQDGRLVVATVSGRPIDAAELLARVYSATPALQDELLDLILEHMVEFEAARLGVTVEPEEVEQAYENAVRALTRELARNRPGTSLDDYVKRGLGLDPEIYRGRLRHRAHRKLTSDRVVRMHLLTSEHVWARMIVVREEDEATAIRNELTAGGDFATLARAHSIDVEDEEARGRLEPVLKADTLVSRLASRAAVGEVVGPTLESGAYMLLLVEERPEPLAGRFSDVHDAVEASLAERPVGDLEIRQWRDAVERRYEVDLAPFLRMVGALPAQR
jgi:hypothetical protein